MNPSRIIYEALSDLLAADTGTLAAVAALHAHPVIDAFTPSLDLLLTDLTLATFTGGAAKSAGIGTQTVFYDPLQNLRTVQILEPAGGWTWLCTVDPVTPETVYGIALSDNTDTDLLGTIVFDTPITISSAGQGFSVPYLRFAFLTQSPF